MKRELKERLGRLGPIQEIDRVDSGSPAVIVLRPKARNSSIRTIDAAQVLARRGLTMLKAKRAIEDAIEVGKAVVEVPMVESQNNLARELERAGFSVKRVRDEVVNVKELRERLGLTQEQFAWQYGLELRTVQGWEKGRSPNHAANTVLLMSSADPDGTAESLEADIA